MIIQILLEMPRFARQLRKDKDESEARPRGMYKKYEVEQPARSYVQRGWGGGHL